MTKLKELIEKRNSLMKELDDICQPAEDEQRTLKDDEVTKVNSKLSEIKKLDAQIEAFQEKRTLEDKKFIEPQKMPTDEQRTLDDIKSFNSYIRGEERALAQSDNGVLVPTTISNKIITKIHELCPLLDWVDLVKIKGVYDCPIHDDSTDITFGYYDELEELVESSTKFKTVRLEGFLAGALVIVSKKLINNTDFDILNFIINRVSFSAYKWINRECFNGTEDKIQGILRSSNNRINASTLNVDSLIEIQSQVPSSLRGSARFVMNSKTLIKIKQLKDADGKPLLNQDIRNAYGWILLGNSIYEDETIPDDTIIYGNFLGLTVKMPQELEIQVLLEKFATKNAIGICAFLEIDAVVSNQQLLAVLKVNE